MEQGKDKTKSFLQTILENTKWQDLYNEHYGKAKVEEELPKGVDLQNHFLKNSNKRYLKWRLKQD